MRSTAIISACSTYRYHLRREWLGRPASFKSVDADTEEFEFGRPVKRPSLLFVMLNPSTADATKDDPTIRKCIGFASQLGYFALEVVNLFAYRATDPRDLRNAWSAGTDVVGEDNDRHIVAAAADADRVIAAWGAFSSCNLRSRATEVLKLLQRHREVSSFGVSKDGSPRHPLMLAYASELKPWSGYA